VAATATIYELYLKILLLARKVQPSFLWAEQLRLPQCLQGLSPRIPAFSVSVGFLGALSVPLVTQFCLDVSIFGAENFLNFKVGHRSPMNSCAALQRSPPGLMLLKRGSHSYFSLILQFQ
jgi:hypothetical protein